MNAASTSATIGVPRSPLSTPHQRLFARTLIRQLDLDTRFITSFHDRFFLAAGLVRPRHLSEVDAVLCGLTKQQISDLIRVMKKEVSDE